MKFQDIPQMTVGANYHVTIPWKMIRETLDRYNDLGRLQLDPEFQRAHVWSEQQQIRYIEYILHGGESGKDIYFNQADWGWKFDRPIYLVDGKQRLEAVRRFLANELPILNGYYFSDFEDNLPRQTFLTFHVNTLKTYAEVLQWYIDLNAGGVAHTDKEIERVKSILETIQYGKA